MSGCFSATICAEAPTLEMIERKVAARGLDESDRASVVTRFKRYTIHRKRAPSAIPDRAMVRSNALVRKFEENQIDVVKILEGENPFEPTLYPTYHAATKVIIESRAFKPKDILSEVRYMTDAKPSSLSSEISRFLTALVSAGVLERKEGKILCLSK